MLVVGAVRFVVENANDYINVAHTCVSDFSRVVAITNRFVIALEKCVVDVHGAYKNELRLWLSDETTT